MLIKIDTFAGARPKMAPSALLPNEAQTAANTKLWKGDIRPFRYPRKTSALSLSNVASLYRYRANNNDYWCESVNDLNFVQSPIAGESYERVYYTGETEPRVLANDILSSPFDFTTDYYKLGVPAPTTELTPGSSGGGSTYRAYVYTYVTRYGEEGPPYADTVGSISDYNVGPITLTGFEAAPAGRAIESVRVYRTNSSDSGVSEFQFVCEATWFSDSEAYAVGDFVIYSNALYKCTTTHPAGAWDAGHFTAGDDVANADLGEVLPSEHWDPPPDDLEGLIGLSNGILAGFKGNRLYLSEPFLPHAWPSTPGGDYTIGFDSNIVALGYFSTHIVVLTEGYPHLVYGETPEQMGKVKLSDFYPCLSKKSVVSAKNAVIFSSKSGLIRIDGNGAQNLTASLADVDDWADYSPSTITGAWYDEKYFGFYASGAGFILDFFSGQALPGSGAQPLFIPLSVYGDAVYISVTDGKFYFVADDSDTGGKCIKEWEGDTLNYLIYTWKSKRFILPRNINFSVARVILDTDFYADVSSTLDLETENAALFDADLLGAINASPINTIEINGDTLYSLGSLSINRNVTFRLYADGELKLTKVLNETDNLFRLPAGFREKRYSIEVSGFVPVKEIAISTSTEELL